jgi:hypothetical protein
MYIAVPSVRADVVRKQQRSTARVAPEKQRPPPLPVKRTLAVVAQRRKVQVERFTVVIESTRMPPPERDAVRSAKKQSMITAQSPVCSMRVATALY